MMWEDAPDNLNDLPPEERDRILEEIMEHVIRPQLENMPGSLLENVHGEAFVFGGHDEQEAKSTIGRIESLLQEGLSMEYIISEMSDLNLQDTVTRSIGNITVNFINLDTHASTNDIPNISADELERMFKL